MTEPGTFSGLGSSESAQDANRQQELQRYRILHTEPEAAFERLVGLAKRLFNVPVVLINFITGDQAWSKASCGTEMFGPNLEPSFCLHVVAQGDVLVVPDARQDPRFYCKDSVIAEPFVRFYAGAPLKSSRGVDLGTLCLIDTVARTDFDDEAQKTLVDLAALVVDELELRLLAAESRTHSERITTVFESITDAFYTLDSEWRFTYLNPEAERFFGFPSTELLGRELWEVFPRLVDSPVYLNHLQAARTGETAHFELFYPPFEGWLEVRIYPSEEGVSVYFQDVSERKEAARRAALHTEFRRGLLSFTQASLQRGLGECFYQELLENAVATIPGAQAGSLLLRKEDGHHFVAAAGFDLEALQRCTFSEENFLFDLSSPEPQLVYAWQVDELDAERRQVMEEHRLSNDIAVSLCVPIMVEGRSVLSLYLDNFDRKDAFDEDATEMARVLAQQAATLMQRLELEATLKEQRGALERLAHFDPITGLPNRWGLDDRLAQAAAQARQHTLPLSVMFLDLDNFKQVNDTYGHSFGDLLLSAVATRLSSGVREGDTVARWGGDEFVVVLPDSGDTSELVTLAERLLTCIGEPFSLGGHWISTNASIGIDVCVDGLANASDLIKNADLALYRAKEDRGSFQFFTDRMRETLRTRVELVRDLQTALEQNALILHYQPRIDLTTGEITSLEALARWSHPSRGWIPPGVFIPLAEESGLIRQLGAQVLDQACAQAKSWRDAGVARRIAVNLSVEQLRHPAIVGEVGRALRRHALEPELLELELTESTAMTDVEASTQKLQQLRDMGVRLAIDDFGTAYSSLAYLNRLPVHSLKIDRSFIQNMGVADRSEKGSHKIVQAILALGKSLGLCVVAEGVETEAQRLALLAFGLGEAQGYLFAKPLPAAQTYNLLTGKVPLRVKQYVSTP